jgi:hypothetical protein
LALLPALRIDKFANIVDLFGGADQDRTDDLLVANEALSQLSYSPTKCDASVLLPDNLVVIPATGSVYQGIYRHSKPVVTGSIA